MKVYYNENDPFAAQWLRNLIAENLIPQGEVDERSIADVDAGDLAGFQQCHFFAGIAGWSLALQLAKWSEDREVWTGSCPCQPFSSAGARRGFSDDRHLWPIWQRLIAKRRPAIVFGEQVARATDWLRLVRSDLEALGYAVGAMSIEAASVGANHRRDRFWFVADAQGVGREQRRSEPVEPWQAGRPLGACGDVPDAQRPELWQQSGRSGGSNGAGASQPGEHGAAQLVADASGGGCQYSRPESTYLDIGARDTTAGGWWDLEPDVGRVAHGVPARVGKLRALGNTIVPQVAAEFIAAYMDAASITGGPS